LKHIFAISIDGVISSPVQLHRRKKSRRYENKCLINYEENENIETVGSRDDWPETSARKMSASRVRNASVITPRVLRQE